MRHMKKPLAALAALVMLLFVFLPTALAVEPHDHVWDGGTVVREATCVQKAQIEYRCTVEGCQQKYREAGDFGPHGETEIRSAKDATCQMKGYTGDEYCTVCNKLVKAGQEIPFAAHTPTDVKNVPATCTTAGYDESKCAVCGVTFQTNKVKALGHVDENKDAKCDRCDTSVAYAGSPTDVCKVCGRVHNLNLADRLEGIWHQITWFFNGAYKAVTDFFANVGK